MKRLFATGLLLAGFVSVGQAQTAPPSGPKTLAATVGLYVFPAQGQDQARQNREEAECYAWAVNTTKSDPFDLSKRAQEAEQSAAAQKAQVQQSGQGAGAKGALVGAATGALIGEIASNDAGEGAAYGAAAGAIAARRRRRRAQEQATEEIDQQTARTQQATAEQIEGFKKAFGVCLEAKKYLVKF
jgi:uncharacterized protein YcfJ